MVDGGGLENRRAQAPGVRIPLPPSRAALVEVVSDDRLPPRAGDPQAEPRELRRLQSGGLTWEVGVAVATATPPVGVRLGPSALGRSAATAVRRPLRIAAVSLAAGRGAAGLVVCDGALLDAGSAGRIAAACGEPVLLAAGGCVTGPAWSGGDPSWPLAALEALAAGVARLAAARRRPALLKLGSAPLEYAPATLDLTPRLTCLDLLCFETADGRPLAQVAFGPPPPAYLEGTATVGDEALLGAREAHEQALGAPLLYLPGAVAGAGEVTGAAAENQARDAQRLAAALLRATADRGAPQVPRLDLREQRLPLRTAPLPERAAVSAALERAAGRAEYGPGEREPARERVAWLGRLELAASEGRTATLEVTLYRWRLGGLELLGAGLALSPAAALRLVEQSSAPVAVTVSAAGGRLGLADPRPGRASLDGEGLEPLCDLWPLAPEATALLAEALAKE